MSLFLERIDLRRGGRLPLSGGAVSIGRSPGNTIALAADDRCVSAYHAVIYADPQRMLLQDLQSTNGTFVNGREVQECVLGAGDEIGLGRSGPKFRVVVEDGVGGVGGVGGVDGINGINSINSINNNGTDNVDGISRINNTYSINNINSINSIDIFDPESSVDAALTGMFEPPPRLSDGVRPPKRPVAVIAALTALGVVLAALAAFTLFIIYTPSQRVYKDGRRLQPAGREFFSTPSPSTSPRSLSGAETPATPTPTPTPTSTTRDRINTVLTRFGEDSYRAPPEMVESVERYLTLYRGPMRGTVALWMERGRRYFPTVRAIFSEKNIPLELAYVSMLESGFNTRAVSRAGAAGMWQFMPNTARRYGLRVGGGVDERIDPEKATKAAAAYFKDLIAIFGSRSSVLLCMAAYNAGEQRVINALKRIDDPVRDRDFWYLYRMGWLAQETNEYIPQVIALIIISDNPGEYGFNNGD